MQRNSGPQPSDTSTDPHRFMDTRQCADYLGISASTLTKWRMHGRGPRFFNFGSLVRYAADDVEAFVAEARRAARPAQSNTAAADACNTGGGIVRPGSADKMMTDAGAR